MALWASRRRREWCRLSELGFRGVGGWEFGIRGGGGGDVALRMGVKYYLYFAACYMGNILVRA